MRACSIPAARILHRVYGRWYDVLQQPRLSRDFAAATATLKLHHTRFCRESVLLGRQDGFGALAVTEWLKAQQLYVLLIKPPLPWHLNFAAFDC